MTTFPNSLSSYKAGKFSEKHLADLVSTFTILIDESFIMAPRSQQFISDKLGPLLHKENTFVILDVDAYLRIRRAVRSNPDAKVAFHAIHFLNKRGMLYVSPTRDEIADPTASMMETLKGFAKSPVCVLTYNKDLVAQVQDCDLAQCICVWALNTDRAYLYSGFNSRLYTVCG